MDELSFRKAVEYFIQTSAYQDFSPDGKEIPARCQERKAGNLCPASGGDYGTMIDLARANQVGSLT